MNIANRQKLLLLDSSTNGGPNILVVANERGGFGGRDFESPGVPTVSILGVGEALPKPLVGNDAFVVDAPLSVTTDMGGRLVTMGIELQGIVIASGKSPNRQGEDKPQFNRLTAIPAVHVQKLIDDYRKANSREPAAGRPSPHSRDVPLVGSGWLPLRRSRSVQSPSPS